MLLGGLMNCTAGDKALTFRFESCVKGDPAGRGS